MRGYTHVHSVASARVDIHRDPKSGKLSDHARLDLGPDVWMFFSLAELAQLREAITTFLDSPEGAELATAQRAAESAPHVEPNPKKENPS